MFATNIIRRRKAATVAHRRARLCQVLLSTCIGVSLASLTFWVSAATDQPGAAQSPELRLLAGVQAVCGGAAVHADGEDVVIPGGTLIEKSPLVVRGREVGQRRRFAMADSGDRVLLETIEPGGLLRRVRAELHTSTENVNRGLRPALVIVADGQCRVQTARRLIYDADGNAEYLEQLTPALDAVHVREPLNPPVPLMAQGGEPEVPGVGVAMLDAGVNYLLPSIAERLARNADGEILGFDYWDMDRRPFDANPVRSPFFPQRHGTQTASLLLHEAPVARLVPYRYPRPDMMRMADLIQQAADDAVVILNISLGSNRKQEWSAFENAAAAHPDMLFVVSAGNNGRDIDSQPVYPASLDLENMLVVSSADPGGRPAQGSNWGRASVDLLVPAEEILTTDFHGRPRVVSGSSYAAARVSALAACLLQQNPEWRAEMLKTAILEQSREPVGGQQAYSAYGFLPDPAARQRGACAAMPREVVESARLIWTYADLAGGAVGIQSSFTHELRDYGGRRLAGGSHPRGGSESRGDSRTMRRRCRRGHGTDCGRARKHEGLPHRLVDAVGVGTRSGEARGLFCQRHASGYRLRRGGFWSIQQPQAQAVGRYRVDHVGRGGSRRHSGPRALSFAGRYRTARYRSVELDVRAHQWNEHDPARESVSALDTRRRGVGKFNPGSLERAKEKGGSRGQIP